MQVVVARIGRPHGLRGEVSIEVRTDTPDSRFVPGARFLTDPPDAGPLTLAGVRDHHRALLLSFAEVPDRDAAQAVRGALLIAEVRDDPEEDAWYDHQLLGLRVRLSTGETIGEVTGLEHGAAQDILLIQEVGELVRLPFVKALVPVVDVPGGFLVIDPPGGLFDAVPTSSPDHGA